MISFQRLTLVADSGSFVGLIGHECLSRLRRKSMQTAGVLVHGCTYQGIHVHKRQTLGCEMQMDWFFQQLTGQQLSGTVYVG
jgi:hypothetical protein